MTLVTVVVTTDENGNPSAKPLVLCDYCTSRSPLPLLNTSYSRAVQVGERVTCCRCGDTFTEYGD